MGLIPSRLSAMEISRLIIHTNKSTKPRSFYSASWSTPTSPTTSSTSSCGPEKTQTSSNLKPCSSKSTWRICISRNPSSKKSSPISIFYMSSRWTETRSLRKSCSRNCQKTSNFSFSKAYTSTCMAGWSGCWKEATNQKICYSTSKKASTLPTKRYSLKTSSWQNFYLSNEVRPKSNVIIMVPPIKLPKL